jgi:hypothetical protein
MGEGEIMNDYFAEAEAEILEAMADLIRVSRRVDGEDISFYNPTALDEPIMKLVKARTLMGMGKAISR